MPHVPDLNAVLTAGYAADRHHSADPIEAVIVATVDEPTGPNVYVVGSGWGDGVYASYVGRAKDGILRVL